MSRVGSTVHSCHTGCHKCSQFLLLDIYQATGLFVRVIAGGKAGMSSIFVSGWPIHAHEKSLLVGHLDQVKLRPPRSNTVSEIAALNTNLCCEQIFNKTRKVTRSRSVQFKFGWPRCPKTHSGRGRLEHLSLESRSNTEHEES